jgi:hypothetical protein
VTFPLRLGSFEGRELMGGPRDGTHSAYLEFWFFEFCFSYAAQVRA